MLENFEGEYGLSPAFSLDPEFELVSTAAEMLAYSPNGEQLAFTDEDQNLVLMNGDGTGAHKALDSGGKVIVFPSWSPDGRYIAFAIGGFFQRPVVPGQLALIRPDGTGLRMLTEGKASSGFASWSTDGKRLVYRVMGDGQQGLRILTLDDGKVATLTNVKPTPAIVGSKRAVGNFSPPATSILSSPYVTSWRHSPCRTRKSSTICCCRPVPKPSSKSLAIPHISAPRSDALACCTPGIGLPQLEMEKAFFR